MSRPRRNAGAGWASGVLALALLAALAAPAGAEPEEGQRLFGSAEPSCATCHTLADAGARGRVGPNLDELQPSREQVSTAVSSGVGAMPSYRGRLSEDQISILSEYVARAAGS